MRCASSMSGKYIENKHMLLSLCFGFSTSSILFYISVIYRCPGIQDYYVFFYYRLRKKKRGRLGKSPTSTRDLVEKGLPNVYSFTGSGEPFLRSCMLYCIYRMWRGQIGYLAFFFRYCGYIEDDQKDLQEDAHRDAMLLFASNTGIFLLQSAEDLFIDGTFLFPSNLSCNLPVLYFYFLCSYLCML